VIPAKISKRAQHDLEEIRGYIAASDPKAAHEVVNAILDIADLLGQQQDAGNPVLHAGPRHADIHWFVVPRFRNYLIFYRPFQGTILVLRVLHASRDWTRFFGK
jgi:plasmid stabilization system protein ParE